VLPFKGRWDSINLACFLLKPLKVARKHVGADPGEWIVIIDPRIVRIIEAPKAHFRDGAGFFTDRVQIFSPHHFVTTGVEDLPRIGRCMPHLRNNDHFRTFATIAHSFPDLDTRRCSE
jgi:hypothetical protein